MLWLTNSTVLPCFWRPLHFSEALFLKFGIADGQDLIDNQNFRLKVRGDRERKPHVHSRRIMLDRRVEKLFDFGKVNDLIELPADLPLRHAEDRAVEEDVFASSEFRMKAGTDLEQARDAPRN